MMYAGNYKIIPACGYRPMIRNRRRFEFPHDYATNEYRDVVIGQLEKWVQQRSVTIQHVKDVSLHDKTVLSMLLEPKKPRLW